MQTTIRVIKFIIAVVVVAALGGAAAYYFYLHSQMAPATIPSGGVASNTSYHGAGNSPLPGASSIASSTNEAMPEQTSVRLWRVSSGPVAGFSFTADSTASSTQLYFVERGSGNVFDADATSQQVIRLTDTLVPKTYEAYFSPTPGIAILRTVQNGLISTLLGSFATPESTSTFPGALSGPTLPDDVRSLAINEDPKKPDIFYIQTLNGRAVGMLTTFSNTKPKQIFSSEVGSWRAFMAGGTPIVLESPSDGVPGYAYSISETGNRSLYAGPLPGLQILPDPTKAALLFSSSSGGQLALYARVSGGAATPLPLATIAEKCAWAPGKYLVAYCAVPESAQQSGFLDLWYQGAVHTSDSWWQINVASGTTQEIYTPASPLDVHDPTIDPTGTYLAFANGTDMSLWVLRIVQ